MEKFKEIEYLSIYLVQVVVGTEDLGEYRVL